MIIAAMLALVVAVPGPAQLTVVGDHLSFDGKRVRLRGVNVCGLEWNAHGENVVRSVPVAFDQWYANIVRLPLCQDRWFGKTDDSPDGGAPYRAIVDKVVKEAAERGKYVLLDLHWSDCGQWGKNVGQHALPDSGSLAFWKDCAARYKNDPAVLFDLYNEPIEASWNTWRNGGSVTERPAGSQVTYDAVGMQTLVDAIRGVGAKNVIVAGGLGYSSRLDFPDDAILKDPGGRGIVYVSHFYPGWENVASWERRITAFQKRKLPLIVSEFGAAPGPDSPEEAAHSVTRVLDVLRSKDLDWIAWCLHPQAGPCLILNWNYEPTPYFGAFVKDALAGKAVAVAPRASTAPDMTVLGDGLGPEWQSWGDARVDFAYTGDKHSGTSSVRVEPGGAGRLQLGRVPFDAAPYRAIVIWLNGGASGGQRLTLQASVMDTPQPQIVALPPLEVHRWIKVEVPLERLGIAGKEDVKSLTIRPADGSPAPEYLVDDFTILGKHGASQARRKPTVARIGDSATRKGEAKS